MDEKGPDSPADWPGPGKGFTPPEPAGPEPDLGPEPPQAPPPYQPPPPPQPYQAPSQPYQAPPPAAWPPPPPGQPVAPTPGQVPPPGQPVAPQAHPPQPQPQPGWQPPPPQPPSGTWQAPPGQPWGYTATPKEPDNGPAVAGFVLSLVAAGLLLFSGGLSSIISVICAAFGIWYSRKGRKKVDDGETPKHRGLAQAGFITGIVSLVLSILATLFWGFFLILALTNEEFRDDLEDDLDDGQFESSMIVLVAVAGRLARALLG